MRYGPFALVTIFVPLLLPSAALANFSDVPANHPNAEAIAYAQTKGIVSGYADGTYHPDATINRAEFVKVLMNAKSISQSERDACVTAHYNSEQARVFFADVIASDWFAGFVCVAAEQGVVSGYPPGTFGGNGYAFFGPDRAINFAEASKIIVKALFAPEVEFEKSHTETWYAEYVFQLTSNNAVPVSIRSADQLLTRGEMVEIIYRLKENVTDKPSTTYEEIAIASAAKTTFTLYFYSEHDVEEVTYKATISVTRTVPKTSKVADTALRTLFAGPSAAEYVRGARTTDALMETGKDYIAITIHPTYPNPYYDEANEEGVYNPREWKNVAIVNFRAVAFEYLNGPAGIQLQVKAPIEATLLHFPTIDHVLYAREGDVFLYWDA